MRAPDALRFIATPLAVSLSVVACEAGTGNGGSAADRHETADASEGTSSGTAAGTSAGSAASSTGAASSGLPDSHAVPDASLADATSAGASRSVDGGPSAPLDGSGPDGSGVRQASDSGASAPPRLDGGGTCTASKPVSTTVSGTGPHRVVVETNSDPGIAEGTIYRPADLGGNGAFPIFVWGEGSCSENGLSNAAAMAEIASYGYFVIADGTPNGTASRTMNASDPAAMGKPLLAYLDWAIAQNDDPCSAYYRSLDTTKIAANGFSCGGLMAEGTAGDPRMTTWAINSSGLFSADQAFYATIHTPVLIVLGGSSDIAYQNGERDYASISALGIPILLFSKNLGHGGDLFSSHGGDFTRIDLAWLNWQLKGDETATGKGALVGPSCTYCSNAAWEVKSANLK